MMLPLPKNAKLIICLLHGILLQYADVSISNGITFIGTGYKKKCLFTYVEIFNHISYVWHSVAAS